MTAPDTERLAQIEDLRPLGTLVALVDAFEELLLNGPPKRGRSIDCRDAHDGWLEHQHGLIKRGRDLIAGLQEPLEIRVAGPRRPTPKEPHGDQV